jgi:hypothetical protein
MLQFTHPLPLPSREGKISIREMSAREAWQYFHDLGQRGFLAEENGAAIGWMGFNSDDQGLYIHSVFCSDEGTACASLVQAAIHLAKELGTEKIRYIVDHDNPHFLRLVESGRASIESYVVAFSTRKHKEK